MRILKKLFKWLFIGVMALVFLLAVASVLMRIRPLEKMPVIRGYKPLVVLGGSMEPAIKVGSVVVVKQVNPTQIKVGDIITFRAPVESDQLVKGERPLTTHRVTKISHRNGRVEFKTKGDANEDPDSWKVTEGDVLGRASFPVPYLGYVSRFARTLRGFILLVILPGLLIIAIEIRNILVQIRLAGRTA